MPDPDSATARQPTGRAPAPDPTADSRPPSTLHVAMRWVAAFLLVAWADAAVSASLRPDDGIATLRLLTGAVLDHAAIGLGLAAVLALGEGLCGRLRRERPVGAVALASALAATAGLHLGHLAALREAPFAGDVVPAALPSSPGGALVAAAVVFLVLRVGLAGLLGIPALRRLAQGPCVPALAVLTAGIGMLAVAFGNPLPRAEADQRLANLNRPPNVILVLADTLRRDRLGFHGYDRHPTSPILDAFAARSTVFENAIANSSWTIPSMASLWTGRWLIEHGASAEMRLLPDSFATLPGVLREHGYRTMAVSSNSMINGPLQGYATPFDWVQDTSTDLVRDTRTRRAPRDVLGLREAAESLTGVALGAPYFRPEQAENPGDLGVHETTEAALQYIDMAREDDRPFFLFAGYFANHMPYQFPPEFDAGFEVTPKPPQRVWDPVIRGASVPGFPSIHLTYWRQLLAATGTHSYVDEDLDFLSDRYDQTVKYLDDECGRLLNGIEERGLLDDTVVIFISDHGESLGEFADFGHGFLLAPQLIDIPLFIYDPERTGGQRVERPVQSIDLLPTVLARLGIDQREATGASLPGTDLFGPGSATPIVAELHYNTGAPGWEHAEPLSSWMHQIMRPAFIQRELGLMETTELRLPEDDVDGETPSLKTLIGRWIQRVRRQPTLVPDLAGLADNSPTVDRPIGPAMPGVTERAFRDYYFAARRALVTAKWSYVRTSTGEELLYDRATGARVADPDETVLASMRERLAQWRKGVTPFDEPVDLANATKNPYLK